MKVWVFKVNKDVTLANKKYYFVEEIGEDLIKIWFSPTKIKYTLWKYIDELKQHGFIEYKTTFETRNGTTFDEMFNTEF